MVGGVATDIVVLVGKFAHVQLWIGSDDKLPRMALAIFLEDPARYRHTVQFSDWKIDPPLAADAFAFTAPAGTIAHTVRAAGRDGKGQVRFSGEHDEQEAASSRCNRHRNAARARRRLVPCRRLERRRRSLVVVGA